jgi:hypothetical protein
LNDLLVAGESADKVGVGQRDLPVFLNAGVATFRFSVGVSKRP